MSTDVLVIATCMFPIVASIILLQFWKKPAYRSVPRIHGRLPIMGNAYQVDLQRCHLIFENWTKQYGPIFEVKLYGEEIVILNDAQCIYEALIEKGDALAGRPRMYRTDHSQRNLRSIVWQTYNPKLIFLRKEVLKSLKMFGNGLLNLEKKCFPELEDLVHVIKENSSSSFYPHAVIQDAVVNVLLLFLIGRRFDSVSPENELLKQIGSQFNIAFGPGKGRVLDIIPWLRVLKNNQHRELEKALASRDHLWEEYILINPISDNSVVGHLLNLLRTDEGQKNDLSIDTIKEVFTNLVLAGSDTTTTAIVCLLSLVLHHPKIQTRIQEEIDSVQKNGGHVTLKDKESMPYTQAVLLETLRYIAHVPLAVPHCTLRDVQLNGYNVAKDTTVYMNIWAAHHDPVVWPEPYSFHPERFLDVDGNLVPPHHPNRKRLLVFGAGRRVCLGEVLARNRLFLFVTTLLKNFTFIPDDPERLPEVDPRHYDLGLVLHPKPFKLKAVKRMH